MSNILTEFGHWYKHVYLKKGGAWIRKKEEWVWRKVGWVRDTAKELLAAGEEESEDIIAQASDGIVITDAETTGEVDLETTFEPTTPSRKVPIEQPSIPIFEGRYVDGSLTNGVTPSKVRRETATVSFYLSGSNFLETDVFSVSGSGVVVKQARVEGKRITVTVNVEADAPLGERNLIVKRGWREVATFSGLLEVIDKLEVSPPPDAPEEGARVKGTEWWND